MDVNSDIKEFITRRLWEDINSSEDYQDSVIKKVVKERYAYYYADPSFYDRKFPKLSKSSKLVSTDCSDTCEWALPSLLRIFFGSEDVIVIQGVMDNDQKGANTMQELIKYQIQRKNNCFLTFYNWFKDALITGMGIVKCSWEREEKVRQTEETMSIIALQQLRQNPNIEILDIQPFDDFGNFSVSYQSTYYAKNSPKIENLLISEFLFSPNCKTLEDVPFTAHKKKVTVSYLRQKEKEGLYANVDDVVNSVEKPLVDDLEQEFMEDNYVSRGFEIDKARREVTIYECYTKMDIDEDGILEDMIITICGNTILRIEENYYGRHPFFTISPIKDPHRLFPKRSFVELIGQLQDQKIALTRQIMLNVAMSNDPRLILSEEAINIDDYIQGRNVIRKKSGYAMSEAVMPMPVVPLHPWTFQLLEYIESQKENRTGVTRYSQGLNGQSLNKTATGISQIMSASNQRLELIARMFAETGIQELFRFLITLNQKFIDQDTVIRVTDRELTITPDDLNGTFDLIVNAGIGIASRESNMMNLQTLMTALMQIMGAGIGIATPSNIFNLMKRWISEAGIKNTADYLTDPAMIQAKMMMDMQMKQQILASLPPEIAQIYMQTGTLPPNVIASLPPEAQMILLGGETLSNGTNTQGNTAQAGGTGEFGGSATGISGQLFGDISKMDNRQSQGLQR